MAIQLHSWPRSSGTRVAWALEELEVPYEYVELDAQQGAHRAPAHLAIHPQGKIPALVDGKRNFFESGAILVHLGETYGVSRRLWPAAGSPEHGDALCWTIWASVELGGHLMQYLYHGRDTPFSYKPEDRSHAAADYSLSQLVRCLDALQARLDGRDHLLGSFTLADIACVSPLLLGLRFGVSLEAHPRVAAWVQRCEARPARKQAR